MKHNSDKKLVATGSTSRVSARAVQYGSVGHEGAKDGVNTITTDHDPVSRGGSDDGNRLDLGAGPMHYLSADSSCMTMTLQIQKRGMRAPK
jgi:hypothetical protein